MIGPIIRPISIVGFPGSGKTTFLAALWHLVQSRELQTRLTFGGLREGNFDHLTEIANRWRSAIEQDRTQIAGLRKVAMDLKTSDGGTVRLNFPDVPGEDFQRMWEGREVGIELADILSSGHVLLLVNGNRIDAPNWIYDEVELCRKIGIERKVGETVPWHPCLAPTQVQLVELLQSLRRAPLDFGARRLSIMISVWDKAAGERREPEPFLREKLPLMHQYLTSGRDGWDWRVYGLSAQGGEYDSNEEGVEPRPEAERLREQDIPSERIQLVSGAAISHDLTEPLEWLIR
ncbi:TRAFAC clade GTPase domain-containing protein [Phenylobacterium montanum]|uniref:Double-GTPase 1 domain-containing protein n=1 Tax=Phenylobacterium montanum TaxID=2823693 RepID=A0A975IX50_9CAUL|nr:hypothetical protein [Caulobacter sp. S6]QUD90588.1 hypothetical protein KCG34_12310 [Caulobacter sp. S6]